MPLRKPTTSPRLTVVQEFRTIIPAELDAQGGTRRVTLMTPASPRINFVITPHEMRTEEGGSVMITEPAELGSNRHYKGTPLPLASTIHFTLDAHQTIIAASVEGMGELGAIVEFV